MKEFVSFLKYQKSLGIDEVILPKDWQQLMQKRTISKPKRTASKTFPTVSSKAVQSLVLPDDLSKLEKIVSGCVTCRLSQGRTQTVFGVGNPHAQLMFVGEAPGRDEDLRGEPFVGRAGKLLTKIINAMGYERKDIYIANINKCRPPNNRVPLPDEVEACMPYLFKQIELIKPKVMVGLGSHAVKSLLKTDEPISKLRGRFFDFHISSHPESSEGSTVKLMATFHPAYLLRNPSMKKLVWEDMQKVMVLLNK